MNTQPWVVAGCEESRHCLLWENWAIVCEMAEKEAEHEANLRATRQKPA